MSQSSPPSIPFAAPHVEVSPASMRVLWCDADAARAARGQRVLGARAVVEVSSDAAAALASARGVLPDIIVSGGAAARALASALNADGRLAGVPLVLLAAGEVEAATLSRDIAAADVIAEPVADYELAARLGTQIEIAQLRRALAEKELESETWLGLALKASGLGVWHARIGAGELHMDANLAAMFGWPAAPLRVRDEEWLARIHPEDRPRVLAEVAARRRDLRPLEVDFRTLLPDGSIRALAVLGAVVRHTDDVAYRSVGVARDVTERARDAERQQLLLSELNHRVRNTLASVLSLAQQTAQDAVSIPAFLDSFRARVLALSAAHQLLTRGRWQGASLGDLVATILAPERTAITAGTGPARVEIDGPACELAPHKALAMTLGLHELATNARKYGALSAPGGRLAVTWSLAEAGGERRLTLVWRERGGPPVAPPTRTGFGTRLLRRALGADLDGTVALDFAPEGLTCTFDFPVPRTPA
jgi:two-component sensor histidine kinase/PAS domain-containing protein